MAGAVSSGNGCFDACARGRHGSRGCVSGSVRVAADRASRSSEGRGASHRTDCCGCGVGGGGGVWACRGRWGGSGCRGRKGWSYGRSTVSWCGRVCFLGRIERRPSQRISAGVERISGPQLQRAERSLQAQIELHEAKIANPAAHVSEWGSLGAREQQGLIRHWGKEIGNFSEQQSIVQELLRR
jgi:hypothetical protein